MRAICSQPVFSKMSSYNRIVKQKLDMVFSMSNFEKLRFLLKTFLTTLKNGNVHWRVSDHTIYGVMNVILRYIAVPHSAGMPPVPTLWGPGSCR